MNSIEESYYDILKVPKKASVSEIVAAYHSVKGAFSKDSVATYSLFSSDETRSELEKLEEAYQVLSNIDKRREYDQKLLKQENQELPKMSELILKRSAEASAMSAPLTPTPVPGGESDASNDPCSGVILKGLRTKRGLSIEDVSRITKIPSKFIAAIEAEEISKLPTRVYIQGFVKNLASLYRLNPSAAGAQYLEKTFKPK